MAGGCAPGCLRARLQLRQCRSTIQICAACSCSRAINVMRQDCWTRRSRTKWSAILLMTRSATRAFRAEAVCGKRGGVRLIYYFAPPDSVYLIAVYAKNEKENLSDAEKQALAKILRPIKQQEH